jgi:hypothetical protein
LFARELKPRQPDPEPFVYQVRKWEHFERALASQADAIAVAFPDVLGDTYTEVPVNLGRLAKSGKMLIVKDTSPFLREMQVSGGESPG